MWTLEQLSNVTCNIDDFSHEEMTCFLDVMNARFPPRVFEDHLNKRRKAIENSARARKLLDNAIQKFPKTVDYTQVDKSDGISKSSMNNTAIVITAGGEGERLRLSLLERGVSESALADFTKATYPLKGFDGNLGALHLNMMMIANIGRECGIDIPVIVTTGPAGTITARVIPSIMREHKNFGLRHVKIICQDERLHFTTDEKIAVTRGSGTIGTPPSPPPSIRSRSPTKRAVRS